MVFHVKTPFGMGHGRGTTIFTPIYGLAYPWGIFDRLQGLSQGSRQYKVRLGHIVVMHVPTTHVTLFGDPADATTHKCQIVDTPLTPEGTTIDYNSHNVEFTPANATQPAQMRVQMQGNSGTRVQPKAPRQLYGQFQATAKVSSAVGAVTAFYVSAALCCTTYAGKTAVRHMHQQPDPLVAKWPKAQQQLCKQETTVATAPQRILCTPKAKPLCSTCKAVGCFKDADIWLHTLCCCRSATQIRMTLRTRATLRRSMWSSSMAVLATPTPCGSTATTGTTAALFCAWVRTGLALRVQSVVWTCAC
jgi:hypothetical protein